MSASRAVGGEVNLDEADVLAERFASGDLHLRPLRRSDAQDIFNEYAQDDLVTRYLVWAPHTEVRETEVYVEHVLRQVREDLLVALVMVETRTGSVCGQIDLRKPSSHRRDLGYVLARRLWHRGLMTKVVRHVVDLLWEDMTVCRIGGVCDVENLGSSRVMEKCNFLQEGRLRRWLVHPAMGSLPRDCLQYSITR